MVTSIAVDGTPEDAAAFVLALLNHPVGAHDELHKIKHELRDINTKLDEINGKVSVSAEDKMELEAFRTVALPVMVAVSNQLNVFTPDA